MSNQTTSLLALDTPPNKTRANTPHVRDERDETSALSDKSSDKADADETARTWACPPSTLGMGAAAPFDNYAS